MFFSEQDTEMPNLRVLSTPDQFRTAESLKEEEANGVEAGVNEMLVIAFEKGRFLTSLEFTIVTREKNEYFTFAQEVVDKSKIKDISNCTEYNQEEVWLNYLFKLRQNKKAKIVDFHFDDRIVLQWMLK